MLAGRSACRRLTACTFSSPLHRPPPTPQEQDALREALLAEATADVEAGGGGGGKQRQHSWLALVGIAANYVWPGTQKKLFLLLLLLCAVLCSVCLGKGVRRHGLLTLAPNRRPPLLHLWSRQPWRRQPGAAAARVRVPGPGHHPAPAQPGGAHPVQKGR